MLKKYPYFIANAKRQRKHAKCVLETHNVQIQRQKKRQSIELQAELIALQYLHAIIVR